MGGTSVQGACNAERAQDEGVHNAAALKKASEPMNAVS